MKSENIISQLTGATIDVVRIGSNVIVVLDGEADEVTHALTLLYNYGAVATWPENRRDSDTHIECQTTRTCLLRGLFALLYAASQCEMNSLSSRYDCVSRMRAAFATAHLVRSLWHAPSVSMNMEEQTA